MKNTFDVLEVEEFKNTEEVFDYMIRIKLKPCRGSGIPQVTNTFGIVSESLRRIGIGCDAEKAKAKGSETKSPRNTLYQSCHLVSENGMYYIASFKLCFSKDNLYNKMTLEDIKRQNTIASMLENWGFIDIVDKSVLDIKNSKFKDLPTNERSESITVLKREQVKSGEWMLSPKYDITKPTVHVAMEDFYD